MPKAGDTEAGTQPILARPWVVCVLALFCCLLWGSSFPSIKIGYGLFGIASGDIASQMLFAGTRFTLAGAGVLAVQGLARDELPLPRKDDLGALFALALTQTILQYLFFYFGLAHASGVSASIVESSNFFLSILFGALIFGQEKLTGNKILGCIIGFTGVVIVSITGSGGMGFALDGEGAIAAAALSSSIATCLLRVFSEKHDPVMLSGWSLVVGGIVLAAVGASLGGCLAPESPAAFALLIYLAFVSATAYSLWSLLLKHNDVATVAIYGFSNPIFGALLSTLVLGEDSGSGAVQVVVALVLVSAGIVLVNKKSAANVKS